MRNCEPCLCGDPECSKCYPGSWRMNLVSRLNMEDAIRENRWCSECNTEILPGEVKHAYGLTLHQACMFEVMARERRNKNRS